MNAKSNNEYHKQTTRSMTTHFNQLWETPGKRGNDECHYHEDITSCDLCSPLIMHLFYNVETVIVSIISLNRKDMEWPSFLLTPKYGHDPIHYY